MFVITEKFVNIGKSLSSLLLSAHIVFFATKYHALRIPLDTQLQTEYPLHFGGIFTYPAFEIMWTRKLDVSTDVELLHGDV